jgi:hypothetical protein
MPGLPCGLHRRSARPPLSLFGVISRTITSFIMPERGRHHDGLLATQQRTGIELTLETAKELRAALDRAIVAAEFEEAEVWCKRVLPSLVRAA